MSSPPNKGLRNIPPLFKDKGFKNYKGKEKTKEELLLFCKGKTEKKSLVFTGEKGTGKTHLAIATCKNMKESKSIFVPAFDFFLTLNQLVQDGKSKLAYIYNLIDYNDVIIFDDLSFDNFTPAKQENLFILIDTMYQKMKRIIITTNETPERMYDSDGKSTDRLREMAEFISFPGESYRGKI